MPELLPALRERRARRAFATRSVLSDVEDLLWQAVSVAPSQGNSQPTRILVAESPDARERLIAALSEGNRQWAPAAPLLCALVANPDHDFVRALKVGMPVAVDPSGAWALVRLPAAAAELAKVRLSTYSFPIEKERAK